MIVLTNLKVLCVLTDLSAVDSGWYNALTTNLTPGQRSQVEDVFKLADQRKAASGTNFYST